jgi:hypothetical protein
MLFVFTFSFGAFLYCHWVLSAGVFVLGLNTLDSAVTHLFVASYVCVGEAAVLFYDDLYRKQGKAY